CGRCAGPGGSSDPRGAGPSGARTRGGNLVFQSGVSKARPPAADATGRGPGGLACYHRRSRRPLNVAASRRAELTDSRPGHANHLRSGEGRCMKRVAVAVLGVVLVVPLVAPTLVGGADTVQWRIVPGGQPIPNNSWVSLYNTQAHGFLERAQRSSGAGLRFDPKAHMVWKFAAKDTADTLHFGDSVCLREKTVGRCLIWAKRKTGVDLTSTPDMAYEWEVRGGEKGAVVGVGTDTTNVSLFNTKTGQYLVYGTQTPGVDLKWAKP